VADAWHAPVISLHLVDPRFYHLDLCFAPLNGGYLMYFPGAFDAASLEKIEAAYGADKRIALSELEATQFGCNVINVGQDILMGAVETDLAGRLSERGFAVTELPLSEFQRGGGSAKSLALRLSDSGLVVRTEAVDSVTRM
jgi:N-dimethylarginine dimethylaminohydrolase